MNRDLPAPDAWPDAAAPAAGAVAGARHRAWVRFLALGTVLASLFIAGDSRRMQIYLRYGFAADAPRYVSGLTPGRHATLAGPGFDAHRARALLALPYDRLPDAVYVVKVDSAVPVIGPSTVPATAMPPRAGGGVDYVFPEGTPPGSVSGPYPLE